MKQLLASVVVVTLGFISSCAPHKEQLKPELNPVVLPTLIQKLPPPFTPLTPDEMKSDWGKELYIAQAFGKDQDLYSAAVTAKRALILERAATPSPERKLQPYYYLLLSYYLGNKYDAVTELFEKERPQALDPQHPSTFPLLTILYDSYLRRGEINKAYELFQLMHQYSPPLAEKMALYTQIASANLPELQKNKSKAIQELTAGYEKNRKSPLRAGVLNGILPGAGYLYVGQTQTAFTSFCLNALFITAAYQFFTHGQTAAGIITAGFETGWYLGGIRGATIAARQYNNTLYSRLANEALTQQKLYPVLMLEYGF